MGRLPVALVLLAACASAGAPDQSVDANGGGGNSDSGGGNSDSGMQLIDSSTATVDAPPGPQTRTLTQTTSQTIKPLGSIACGGNGTTTANNYYRVFDLPAMGINTAFNVTKVSFQIEHCDRVVSGSGCTTVAVRVGTYAGTPGTTLSNASMTILASNANVMVPEVIESQGPPPSTPGGIVDAPITATIPAGSKLLVEVDAPDGTNTYGFYMGANDGGESGFGYIVAPTCSISTPTNISSVGTPGPRHLLLTVTGTY